MNLIMHRIRPIRLLHFVKDQAAFQDGEFAEFSFPLLSLWAETFVPMCLAIASCINYMHCIASAASWLLAFRLHSREESRSAPQHLPGLLYLKFLSFLFRLFLCTAALLPRLEGQELDSLIKLLLDRVQRLQDQIALLSMEQNLRLEAERNIVTFRSELEKLKRIALSPLRKFWSFFL